MDYSGTSSKYMHAMSSQYENEEDYHRNSDNPINYGAFGDFWENSMENVPNAPRNARYPNRYQDKREQIESCNNGSNKHHCYNSNYH